VSGLEPVAAHEATHPGDRALGDFAMHAHLVAGGVDDADD
jgi:hypothetical protein